MKKYQEIFDHFQELEKQLGSSEISKNPIKLKQLSSDYKELEDVIPQIKKYLRLEKQLQEAEDTIQEKDEELISIAKAEIPGIKNQLSELKTEIDKKIAAQDPLDKKDILLEIRAGTGGEEAALFAADLFRMYSRFAERQGWKTKLISANRTGIGGFKEAILEINGDNVYSQLKYEGGVHRVQRVPETEKSGRLHTSAATVAVLPKADEVDISLKPKELKIEAMTSSGHGGQSVNTTYSAIRITHLPTGMVVQCQDERSQQQNRERALSILRSRLFAAEQEKQQKAISDQRKKMVASGDRSEKIRTYNFPQNRITDHRINYTAHKLEAILDGELQDLTKALKEKINQ